MEVLGQNVTIILLIIGLQSSIYDGFRKQEALDLAYSDWRQNKDDCM